MKFTSIAKKAFHYLDRYRLKKFAVNNSMYYVGETAALAKVRRVLLFFPNPEYMHLGDHLFFEPLANFLRSSGLRVKICPIKAMEFYFTANGYQIAGEDALEKVDLVITRPEFIPVFRRKQANVIFMDTVSALIREPLCQDIVDKTAKLLGLNSAGYRAKPAGLSQPASSIKLDPDSRYLVFNNYIDSGFHRVRRWHYARLAARAAQLARERGLKVIHIGTQKDKDRDKKRYDFVSLDLRGRTSPADIFYLAAQPNVVCNVSFDTFPMHVFALYGKKSFVLYRARARARDNRCIRDFVLPPFSPGRPKEELVEFL